VINTCGVITTPRSHVQTNSKNKSKDNPIVYDAANHNPDQIPGKNHLFYLFMLKKNLFYLGAWTIVKYCPKNHTATATDAQNWQPHHTRAATATPMTQAMVPGSRPSKQAADEPGVVNVMGPWTTLPWL